MSVFIGYLLIFLARVTDVSMATVRTLMVVQGRKIQAAFIGFFEVMVYVAALSKVVNGLNDPRNLIAYALGFATGNYMGILIESKIALGNLTAQIILKREDNADLIQSLRENGFGVTVLEGYGKEGMREVLHIVLKRKDLKVLENILHDHDEEAFITVNPITPIMGGYFAGSKKK